MFSSELARRVEVFESRRGYVCDATALGREEEGSMGSTIEKYARVLRQSVKEELRGRWHQ